MQGVEGQLFYDLALTLAVAVTASLFVAGVFSVVFSVWYLFFAKGGNLFLYPSEVMRFFSGG
jgi:multidrug efflux pump subunit AcrB